MRRAGRSVFKHTRQRRWRWLLANWKVATLLLGTAAVFTLLVMAWGTANFIVGFFVGVLWAGAIGALFYFMALTGEAQRRMGGIAEQWTAKALRRLDDQWNVLHDIQFAHGNVDHVAVGPDFVVVVETKWTSNDPDFENPSDDWTRRAIERCAQQARQIQLLLRSEGIDRTVLPLLVYWGPGAWDLPGEPEHFGDVRVVGGPRARVWTKKLCEVSERTEPDTDATEALEGYVTRRTAYERERGWLRSRT